MVNDMSINYIKINKQNLEDNILTIKKRYSFSYYILDVSNHAFYHGLYLVKYLDDKIDYLYVNHFNDLIWVRKYQSDIPVIYDGEIDEDRLYDLIMMNAIVVVRDISILKLVRSLNLHDTFSFLFYIDVQGEIGINNRLDIIDYLDDGFEYMKLLGYIAHIDEKDYEEFKYIVKPIQNSLLHILNSEADKNKIHGSNAILLDNSVYGTYLEKRKLFQKEDISLKQVFTLYSKVIKVIKTKNNKRIKYTAIIPFGYHHGMSDLIKKIVIDSKLYNVFKILNEFTYIEVDENIKVDMEVCITGFSNPLSSYFPNQTSNYFSLFYNNLPIIFDDYIIDKSSMY